MADAINPSHYKQGKVECIDAIESATIHKTGLEAVCTANVIKYLFRYESKNGLEDVRKAKWYIDKLISFLESQEKKPIQHFKPMPRPVIDPLDHMPCIPTPQYPCEAVNPIIGSDASVHLYNAQNITGTLKAENNDKNCLD